MKSFLLLLLLSNFIIASNSASILEQLQDGVNQLQRFKQKVGELRRNEDKLELKNVELESNLDSSAQGMNLNCQHVERCKRTDMPPGKRCRQQVCLAKRCQRQPSANHNVTVCVCE